MKAEDVIAQLKAKATKKHRDGLARFAIPSDKAFGVRMKDVQAVAKRAGRNHELAEDLWQSGWLEARLACAYIDEPERVTVAQMDRWCRQFDNWAVVDTLAFALFDRTPHAWGRVKAWAGRKEEFQRRAGFALLWSLSVHDRVSGDKPFLDGLKLVEKHATDERNFVKKAVNMALRATGKRNAALNEAAIAVATRLAASMNPTARWIGKDALRELASASLRLRIRRASPSAPTRGRSPARPGRRRSPSARG